MLKWTLEIRTGGFVNGKRIAVKREKEFYEGGYRDAVETIRKRYFTEEEWNQIKYSKGDKWLITRNIPDGVIQSDYYLRSYDEYDDIDDEG